MPRTTFAASVLIFAGSFFYCFGQQQNSAAQASTAAVGKGVVNIVSDCGAVGDGVTDDWRVIQACISDHPGKTIFFPKMRSVPCDRGSGGGCIGSVDYYVSQTLMLSGNAQALIGESPSRWPGGAVQIKFPRDLNEPGIWIPATVYSGYVGNLFLNGQRCWNSTDLTTFDEPTSLSGLGPDGVLVTGGQPTLYGVTAYCFGRHGFAVLGDSSAHEAAPGQPDFWNIENSFAIANRGYGLYINGGDSNAGESIALKTTGNQLGGIYDHSVLGNTHISPASHMDNRNPVLAGIKHPITTISSENGLCKLTLQSGGEQLTSKDAWITVAGTSGGQNFDGTYRLLIPNVAPQTVGYPCSASGGPAKGGTVAQASSTEIYNAYHAKGIPTGAYLGRSGSSVDVWINPYCETNSNAPDFASSSIVIGRGCEENVSGDRTWVAWTPGPGWSSTIRAGQGLNLDNGSDTMNWLTIRAGRSKEQFKGIRFASPEEVTWEIGEYPNHTFFIQDLKNKAFNTITLNTGGATDISAPNDSPIRLAVGSTGGVQFFGGKKEVAKIDSSGKAQFTGVCLSPDVCWSAGRGAPSEAACTRAKAGSLYTRTDGGSGTALYVCEGSTGTWTAK